METGWLRTSHKQATVSEVQTRVEYSPVDGKAIKNGSRLSRFQSWRFTLSCGAAIISIVLVANLGLYIWAKSKFPTHNSIITIFEGSCSTMQKIATWSHLGVNILSTLLLSASNACMQCLAAPTRKEVDVSHSKGRWLNIGVLSSRNLTAIGRWRIILWAALAASSIPIHLLYNSAIFSTASAYEYIALVVTPNFVTGGPWVSRSLFASNFGKIQAEAATLYTHKLSNAECIEAYMNNYVSKYRNVLLVSYTPNNTSTILLSFVHFPSSSPPSPTWICQSQSKCDYQDQLRKAASWTFEEVSCGDMPEDSCPDGDIVDVKIDHCLAQPGVESCKIQLSQTLLLIVIVCNAIKLLCIVASIFMPNHEPLVTTGDALASFLSQPDLYTLDLGPVAARDVGKKGRESQMQPHIKTWKTTRTQWSQAASKRHWVISTLCLLGVWVFAFALLLQALLRRRSHDSSMFAAGLGEVNFDYEVGFAKRQPLTFHVIIANTPQLIISFLYLTYNSLLTSMLGSAELSQFVKTPKALRVSQPVEGQRSTYWLQLPYRWAIPLMSAMSLLHWFVSQSIFLAQVTFFDFDNNVEPDSKLSHLGWSPSGLLASLCTGGVMIVVLLGLGFRKLDAGMPTVSNCSIALSAACHHVPQDIDASTLPVQYGVLSTGEREHVGFGSHIIGPLIDGKVYT